jgi:hypothetical protein
MHEESDLRRRMRGLLGSVEPPPVPVEQIVRRARTIRLRRTGAAVGGIAVAGIAAAAVMLVATPHPAGPASYPAGGASPTPAVSESPIRSAVPPIPIPSATVSLNTTGTGAGGVFATGTANQKRWQLTVQNVADAGHACLPAVTVNGQDADPLFPDPPMLTPAGNPSFVTGIDPAPSAAFGFLRVPAAVTRLVVQVGTGTPLNLRPVMVTACGEQFRLAGFAVGASGPVQITAYTAAGAAAPYTVPSSIIWPARFVTVTPVGGAWQNLDLSRGFGTFHVIAHGKARVGGYAEGWQISAAVGASGECYLAQSQFLGPQGTTTSCAPVGTPDGAQAIVGLPGTSYDGIPVSQYALAVGPDVASVTARLSGGRTVRLTPVAAGGRRYVAFTVTGATVTRLTWYGAGGRVLASVTSLPEDGEAAWIQFKA